MVGPTAQHSGNQSYGPLERSVSVGLALIPRPFDDKSPTRRYRVAVLTNPTLPRCGTDQFQQEVDCLFHREKILKPSGPLLNLTCELPRIGGVN
jgi:hypothetical protein